MSDTDFYQPTAPAIKTLCTQEIGDRLHRHLMFTFLTLCGRSNRWWMQWPYQERCSEYPWWQRMTTQTGGRALGFTVATVLSRFTASAASLLVPSSFQTQIDLPRLMMKCWLVGTPNLIQTHILNRPLRMTWTCKFACTSWLKNKCLIHARMLSSQVCTGKNERSTPRKKIEEGSRRRMVTGKWRRKRNGSHKTSENKIIPHWNKQHYSPTVSLLSSVGKRQWR